MSESAGTRTAMIYSWLFPESIHRSVMIAVNPPGSFLWDAKTTDEQIGRYADLCSKDDSCSKRTDGLAASMRRTAADMPDRWMFLPVKEGNVLAGSLFGLFETTSKAAPLSAPTTLDSWLSAAEGDASGFWLMSLAADFFFPDMTVWGQRAAAARADAQATRDYFSSGGQERDSNLGSAATAFSWGGGRLADAWPAAPDEGEYSRVRTSDVETLLIGGALDFSTPPQAATNELFPYLPNGHQVVLPSFGHTTDFWTYQPEAGTRLITTFFDSGEEDDSLYKPQRVDFTPEVTQTALAKRIAGTMVGLALLAVLSLPWMARRVHKKGGFGRKASATLRSLYPIVLGLGGWFLGALIVITTMPASHSTTSCSPASPSACRSGSVSTWRGFTVTGRPRRNESDSPQRQAARSWALGWGSTQRMNMSACHRDRWSRRRRQSHADPSRHVAGRVRSRSDRNKCVGERAPAEPRASGADRCREAVTSPASKSKTLSQQIGDEGCGSRLQLRHSAGAMRGEGVGCGIRAPSGHPGVSAVALMGLVVAPAGPAAAAAPMVERTIVVSVHLRGPGRRRLVQVDAALYEVGGDPTLQVYVSRPTEFIGPDFEQPADCRRAEP